MGVIPGNDTISPRPIISLAAAVEGRVGRADGSFLPRGLPLGQQLTEATNNLPPHIESEAGGIIPPRSVTDEPDRRDRQTDESGARRWRSCVRHFSERETRHPIPGENRRQPQFHDAEDSRGDSTEDDGRLKMPNARDVI